MSNLLRRVDRLEMELVPAMNWREAVRRWVRGEYVADIPMSRDWHDLTDAERAQVRALEDRINEMGEVGSTADKIIAEIEAAISALVSQVTQRREANHDTTSQAA